MTVTQALSLLPLFLNASLLVKLVMALLLAVSVMSWAYIFRKMFALRNAQTQTEEFERAFWSGGNLTELYQDAEVRKAIPWAASVATALEGAHPRPVSARYSEMSYVIRSTTSAMLGRSQAVPAGVADIESRLKRVTR